MTDSPKTEVRVRFAPSPTGLFHFGTARSALFNWLFSRNQGGKFILRIEDTDIERSEAKYEEDIINGLKWLGIDWDEGPRSADSRELNVNPRGRYIGDYGPYRQSERGGIYEHYIKKLFDKGNAYYCFCSKEELEADRQAMLSQGLPPKYSNRCRNISREESEKRLAKGEEAVIRFKMPETEVEFNDIIRGKVRFDSRLIGDIVIAKNLRSPLFILAGAIDDFEMKITYVIRGEDHISNTPKQILIGKTLGFDEIKYAHLPLILAPDRSKLSKRYIETSINDYKNSGYLSDAIVNFTALLGWHPKDDREILSREELIKEFDLKRVQKASAVFNIEKLDWFNAQYIKNFDVVHLAKQIKDFIPEEWLENKELLIKAVGIEKERMIRIADFKNLADFFFKLPNYEPKLLNWQQSMTDDKISSNLKLLTEEIEKVPETDFTKENLIRIIMPLTEVWGRGELLWPLRVALSGKQASPGPFEIMDALGKEETLKRIKVAVKKL